MTRKKKLFLNMGTGVLKQVIVTVCGFILPRYMLLYYGSAVNGLISSITHFLSFISLLELGIGPVIQANLYKPLADKNDDQVSKVVISAERFFRRIAYIFLAYIAVLVVVYPLATNLEYGYWFSASLIVIISISTFAQYYFGMAYQLLLNSDQKAYIQITLQIVTVILNTIFAVVLMKLGAPVHVVKLATAVFYVLRPLGQMLYVHRHYNINKKLVLTEEPIKQKWNGFSQHLASVVTGNVDVVLLTFFSSLENISIYNIYYTVTNGLTQMIMTAATGLESMFGNMIAKNEMETLNQTFRTVEFAVHTVVSITFSIAAIMIVPFVLVYTRGVTDANYYAPMFGIMLVSAYASQCLRIPYFRVIKAAGKFKETQNGAFISMGLNIIISVVFIFKFGLVGIAFGTLIAMLYHTVYFAWYLQSNILCRPFFKFVLYFLSDIAIGVISYFIASRMNLTCSGYGQWVLVAVKVALMVVAVAIVVNCALHFTEAKSLFMAIKEKKRRNNNG